MRRVTKNNFKREVVIYTLTYSIEEQFYKAGDCVAMMNEKYYGIVKNVVVEVATRLMETSVMQIEDSSF